MTQHRTFEELPVWQAARQLCRDIYGLARQPQFARDRGLTDQITRSAVSILSNIAEGVERGTTEELIAFLFYAKGSAGEVRAQLYIVEDQGYAPGQECARLRRSAEGIGRQLSGWIKSLQTPDAARGPRYHREKSASQKTWEQMREQFLARPPWGKGTENGTGKMENNQPTRGTRS
jgi:four helix bundle protein